MPQIVTALFQKKSYRWKIRSPLSSPPLFWSYYEYFSISSFECPLHIGCAVGLCVARGRGSWGGPGAAGRAQARTCIAHSKGFGLEIKTEAGSRTKSKRSCIGWAGRENKRIELACTRGKWGKWFVNKCWINKKKPMKISRNVCINILICRKKYERVNNSDHKETNFRNMTRSKSDKVPSAQLTQC